MAPLSRVREGDEILCNVRGRTFHAIVEEKRPGELDIKPLDPRINYFRVTAQQVERVVKRSSK